MNVILNLSLLSKARIHFQFARISWQQVLTPLTARRRWGRKWLMENILSKRINQLERRQQTLFPWSSSNIRAVNKHGLVPSKRQFLCGRKVNPLHFTIRSARPGQEVWYDLDPDAWHLIVSRTTKRRIIVTPPRNFLWQAPRYDIYQFHELLYSG